MPSRHFGNTRLSELPVEDLLRTAIDAERTGTERAAITRLSNALARGAQDPRLHQMLGLLHRPFDETEQALRHLSRAAQLAPDDTRILHGVAQVMFDAGQDALDAFSRLHALAPTNRSILLGYASALFASGQGHVAEARLEDTLATSPGWTEGHATLIQLRWQAGQKLEAWRTLDAAIVRNPQNRDLWHEKIRGLMQAEIFDRALHTVQQARQTVGADVFFALSEAACLDELGLPEKAFNAFVAMGRVAHPQVAVRFIRHLLRTGRPADAAAVALPWTQEAQASQFWPYLATAWRMLDDPRWAWLEGDARLVGVYDLRPHIGSLDTLAQTLRRLHKASHQPLEQSVRAGTQTDGKLFARMDPEIRRLRHAIANVVRSHIAQLPPYDPNHPVLGIPRTAVQDDVRFSGSWSVRLTGAGHHAVHMHPQGWFSSAFYVSVPDNLDEQGPDAGCLTLGNQPEFPDSPPPLRTIRPQAGHLVLFPSMLWHGTRPIYEGERMTVAFDVAPPPAVPQE